MREDFTDLRNQMNNGFAGVNSRFAEINDRFAAVDNAFLEVRGRLDGAAAGQQQIVNLLNTLIDREGEESADH